jgi:succinate dehydrogenase/fumarate reductase flavoprotein subunit
MWQGSANYGAIAFMPGGNPISLAIVTGFWAGTAAGKAAANTPEPKISKAEVNQLQKEILAPLGKKDGYNAYDAVKDVQEVVFKLKNSFVKREDRLQNALGKIEEIQAKFANLTAKDSHELVRCHEAKAMATNAELLYKASLLRKETRGCHIREDYPNKDDKNWLKWIILKKEDGKTKSWTEPVPIEKYKYKPA